MRANKQKVDKSELNNNTEKMKISSNPQSKKANQTIKSQSKSLKIGDKITSNGVIKKTIQKVQPKLSSNAKIHEDYSKQTKLEKQQSGNCDMEEITQNHNFHSDKNQNPLSCQFELEFPPIFQNDSLPQINYNKSLDSSHSSSECKKQRVQIRQSISNENNKVKDFNIENLNHENTVQINANRNNSMINESTENNNYMQGINFSFQAQDDLLDKQTSDFQIQQQYLDLYQQSFPYSNQQKQIYKIDKQNQQTKIFINREYIQNENVEINSDNQNMFQRKNSKKSSIQIQHMESSEIINLIYEEQQLIQQKSIQNNSNGQNQFIRSRNNSVPQNIQENANQIKQNLLIAQNPQQLNIGGVPNSIVGSHGDKQKGSFSLADQLVIKKSGRYQDEYENVESDSNSQKNGKRLIMLGRGGFGQVYLIKQRTGNKEERAMKVIMKQQQESLREVTILKKFSHPNVLKIYEYFEDEQNLYVITERCYGYNLFDYIIFKGQFTEQETCKIADGVLRALAEAHKQNIVHRDVKPENIMLDFNDTRESFIVKLIDWGLAEQISGENKYLTKRCGTLHYLAPEVLLKKYNEKVDLWSLGMVLFTLIQGSPPICGKSQMDILEQINDFRVDFKYFCWKSISDEGKDLIQKLLDRDPNKRISAIEALKHPWFSKFLCVADINTQDLRSSYTSLIKYTSQNAFKKTVLGFFASHVVSKRERNKYIEIFQALDTDKNGELSIDELKSGFSKIFDESEFGFCQGQIEEIFIGSLSSRFENAQGIKYEEFLSSMLSCSATYSEEQLFEAFQLFDKDKNGKITLTEIIETLGIQEQNELICCFNGIINEFDENQDGEIDFEEFRLIMTNFLDKHSQDILSQDLYLQ